MGKLEGRVAIVTGAARGQGEAEARLFVEEGARVLVADVLEEKGRAVAAELGAQGAFERLDVSDRASWDRAVAHALDAWGAVDVLVNNAGITQLGPFEDITLEELRRVFEVNQLGVFNGMQAVFPAMRAQGRGAIVNTSSASALHSMPGLGAYAPSKAAVLAMTKIVAFEWGHHGIRVNAILPGAIDTPMLRGDHTEAVDFGTYFDDQPIPRPGDVDEIARVALFLACEDSSFITGESILVDGGRASARAITAVK